MVLNNLKMKNSSHANVSNEGHVNPMTAAQPNKKSSIRRVQPGSYWLAIAWFAGWMVFSQTALGQANALGQTKGDQGRARAQAKAAEGQAKAAQNKANAQAKAAQARARAQQKGPPGGRPMPAEDAQERLIEQQQEAAERAREVQEELREQQQEAAERARDAQERLREARQEAAERARDF